MRISEKKIEHQENMIKEYQKIIETLKLEIQNNLDLKYLKNIIFKFFQSDFSVTLYFVLKNFKEIFQRLKN